MSLKRKGKQFLDSDGFLTSLHLLVTTAAQMNSAFLHWLCEIVQKDKWVT